ncbi:hypothetical protein P700755_000255 [Psychroflexus torquis ATCC 700755]|uniref:Uncharacterized protein n=1 Tax=Psychroflexus torquis (strain ATCC 700755 / CIP 106069 / ACAM 623) TaxID=313595 RepID=K4IBK7_PSYTT|nr:helix-turn-helix transcriptional regulator [Psychroflexus torquis]AFU67298.1 hypothetical protein P700755_000255 [Psychroflexus torquis ATCC 700755]
MAKKKKITMTVEKTDTGFSAFSEDYPIFTTGKSIPELINNTYEGTELHFEEEIVKFEHSNIKFEIDFKQFFKFYKVINAKFLAEKIGMNETLLSQYVQGHKKPSAKQTEKILSGIHQIGQELSGINLLQTT